MMKAAENYVRNVIISEEGKNVKVWGKMIYDGAKKVPSRSWSSTMLVRSSYGICPTR